MWPWSMIAIRSASWSASSRYWVVSNTVVPSVVEPAHLFPQREPAHRVEPGGGLVEEQHGGLMDQREGEIESPPHAARVGADATLGRTRETDPLEEIGAALLHRSPSGCRTARPAARAARDRSSADRWPRPASATPMLRRTESASLHHVETGHPRDAGRGPQQGGEHPHGRALAGAVGAEEAEHLARLDLEIDTVDRPHVAEVTNETFGIDGEAISCHRRHCAAGVRVSRRRTPAASTPMPASSDVSSASRRRRQGWRRPTAWRRRPASCRRRR